MVAIALGKGRGGLERAQSFLSIDRDHVFLMAFKNAEEGDDVVLRVCETENRQAPVNVRFFAKATRAVECDMLERETGPARLVSGILRFDIRRL